MARSSGRAAPTRCASRAIHEDDRSSAPVRLRRLRHPVGWLVHPAVLHQPDVPRVAPMRMTGPALLFACALAGASCGIPREDLLGQPHCPDFDSEIAPVLANGCAGCHGGLTPAAGYSVADRLSVLERRDDGTPRLVPGDAESDFMLAARGGRSGHTALPSDQAALLEDWAVRCRAGPHRLAVHPPGWTTPTDDQQFHGAALKEGAYELAPCRQCHGADLGGGTAKVACATCHP